MYSAWLFANESLIVPVLVLDDGAMIEGGHWQSGGRLRQHCRRSHVLVMMRMVEKMGRLRWVLLLVVVVVKMGRRRRKVNTVLVLKIGRRLVRRRRRRHRGGRARDNATVQIGLVLGRLLVPPLLGGDYKLVEDRLDDNHFSVHANHVTLIEHSVGDVYERKGRTILDFDHERLLKVNLQLEHFEKVVTERNRVHVGVFVAAQMDLIVGQIKEETKENRIVRVERHSKAPPTLGRRAQFDFAAEFADALHRHRERDRRTFNGELFVRLGQHCRCGGASECESQRKGNQ